MEQQLREILNSLYEAEALLEMAIRRPGANRESIIALAREKCFQAADKAFSLKLEESAVSENPSEQGRTENSANADASEKVADDAVNSPDEKDESELLFEEKIVPALSVAAESASPLQESQAHEPERKESLMAEASDREEESEELTAEAYTEEDNAVCAEDTVSAFEEIPVIAEPEEVLDEPDYGDSEDELEEERRSMRMIDRKPIASFFSINDKFRFRRELFSNSNPEWLNALALLETMADLKEAEDYLFDDLQWDPESQDVQAFIQVLTRYYNS